MKLFILSTYLLFSSLFVPIEARELSENSSLKYEILNSIPTQFQTRKIEGSRLQTLDNSGATVSYPDYLSFLHYLLYSFSLGYCSNCVSISFSHSSGLSPPV